MEDLIARISELEKQIAELTGKEAQAKKQQQLEPVECPVCHKQLKNKYTLKTHMKHHEEGSTKVECPVCHKHYCSVYYLKSHMKREHGDCDNHEGDSLKLSLKASPEDTRVK